MTGSLKFIKGELGGGGKDHKTKRAFMLLYLAWLHDIVEDTPVTKEMIHRIFGLEIAEMVFGVTNEPRKADVSQKERKIKTFTRTAQRLDSTLLKLADRIANVEESLTNYFYERPTKIDKYVDEWPLFKQLLFKPGQADKMWSHLERLLTDKNYAYNFIVTTNPQAFTVLQ